MHWHNCFDKPLITSVIPWINICSKRCVKQEKLLWHPWGLMLKIIRRVLLFNSFKITWQQSSCTEMYTIITSMLNPTCLSHDLIPKRKSTILNVQRSDSTNYCLCLRNIEIQNLYDAATPQRGKIRRFTTKREVDVWPRCTSSNLTRNSSALR